MTTTSVEAKPVRVIRAGTDGALKTLRIATPVSKTQGVQAAASWTKATCSWTKATCSWTKATCSWTKATC